MTYSLQVYVTTRSTPAQTPTIINLSALGGYMAWVDKEQVFATIPSLPTKTYGHITELAYYQKEDYKVTLSKNDHCILPGNTKVKLEWVADPQIVSKSWRTVYQDARLNYVRSKAKKLSSRDASVFRIPDAGAVRTSDGKRNKFYVSGAVVSPEEAAIIGQSPTNTPFTVEIANLKGAGLDANVDTIIWERIIHQQYSSWVYPMYDRYIRNKRLEWLVRVVQSNGVAITYVNNGHELTEKEANQLIAQKLLKLWDDEQNLVPNSRNTITLQEFRFRELSQPSLAPMSEKLARMKEDFIKVSSVQDDDGKRGIWKLALTDVVKLLELAIHSFEIADKKVKKL